jgi:hypothetical protein
VVEVAHPTALLVATVLLEVLAEEQTTATTCKFVLVELQLKLELVELVMAMLVVEQLITVQVAVVVRVLLVAQALVAK